MDRSIGALQKEKVDTLPRAISSDKDARFLWVNALTHVADAARINGI